jgi:ankyrin repeat protein
MGQVASSLPSDEAELAALFLAAGEQDDCQVIDEVTRRHGHNARLLNTRDSAGFTCLHRCVLRQHLTCVRCLLHAPALELRTTDSVYLYLSVVFRSLLCRYRVSCVCR